MQLDGDASIRASVSLNSTLPGAMLRLILYFDALKVDLATVSNVSVDIYRIERERNQFAFGFGTTPVLQDRSLEVSQLLPIDFPTGLYIVSCATLVWGTSPGANQKKFTFNAIVFAVQSVNEKPFSSVELDHQVNEAISQRAEYVHHSLKTALAKNGVATARFRVVIFGVGCLLHSQQQLEGYSIVPLGVGLSHRRMHDLVNMVLQRESVAPIDFDPLAEIHFESTTPTFIVSYPSVEALDQQDALSHCRAHSHNIFHVLGLERGQMPREFAVIVLEHGSAKYLRSFQMPGYRGNLASDFNPSSTANAIERLLPKLAENPFLRLIAKTYGDATAEADHGFALLRFWAVLELLADKYVTRGQCVRLPRGEIILDAKGVPETTHSKHGRVYSYIRGNDVFLTSGTYGDVGAQKKFLIGGDSTHPGYTADTELISLWDIVRAAYAIRNAIAHEGQFDLKVAEGSNTYAQLAAKLVDSGYADPMRFLKQQAQMAFWKEANKPLQ